MAKRNRNRDSGGNSDNWFIIIIEIIGIIIESLITII